VADTDDDRELALLAGVQLPGCADEEEAESMEELAALADTAGADVISSFVQRRTSYDPNTLIGRGKVDELAASVSESGATLVIFDADLSSGQQDRLSKALDARVIDRTALILDIFAQHAHTREGRTQVELAQLSYLLPRIRGRGIEMSRMAGGIGTRRGPGETQLEVDRRTIRRRIKKLERDLEGMESVRSTQRKRRARAGLSQVSLVGYTNSGKSSLLNLLTDSSVPVEDRLFSTLDSTTRKMLLPDGRSAVLSDTVGFIRKLPHELVAAFHSTLEVVRDADLLVHVIDGSTGEDVGDRMSAVLAVLDELGAGELPRIDAFNKTDLLDGAAMMETGRRHPTGVLVSAKTSEGKGALLAAISDRLGPTRVVSLEIPSARGDILASIYREGRVMDVVHDGETSLVTAELPSDRLEQFRAFVR
jgi:GTP-binding protein HflX